MFWQTDRLREGIRADTFVCCRNLIRHIGMVTVQGLTVLFQWLICVVCTLCGFHCPANKETTLFTNGNNAVHLFVLHLYGRRLSASSTQGQHCGQNDVIDMFHIHFTVSFVPPYTSDIDIVSSAWSICFTSSSDKRTSTAPAFSFNRSDLRVPGMGTIHGFLQSTQARDICAGVTCLSLAMRRMNCSSS